MEERLRKLEDAKLKMEMSLKFAGFLALAFGISTTWAGKVLIETGRRLDEISFKVTNARDQIQEAVTNGIRRVDSSVGVKVSEAIGTQLPFRRIDTGRLNFDGNSAQFFIETGTTNVPVACFGGIKGFPDVTEFWCKGEDWKGKKGVHAYVRFERAAVGSNIAVNLFQVGMTGPFTVSPMK